MEKQYYHFKRSSSTPSVATSCEHFYVCGDETEWRDIMRQFAAFLDSCGYVGVHEQIDWLLDKDNVYEDFGNPGLSD